MSDSERQELRERLDREIDELQAERVSNGRRLAFAAAVTLVLIFGVVSLALAAFADSGNPVWAIVASGWMTVAGFMVGFGMARYA